MDTETSETHLVTVTFQMEEMTGTPEESAEVLLDQYIADEVTVRDVAAWRKVPHDAKGAHMQVLAETPRVGPPWL